MTLRPVPLMVAFVALLVSGLVHGFWTQRWQSDAALDAAVARLSTVPMQAGSWKGATIEVDPEPFRQARAVGYWMRRYTKPGAGDSITVILMCGRAGHMSVHTPDICFRGAGYEMAGQAVHVRTDQAEFWTARFRPPGPTGAGDLAIYWTWGGDGGWQAPNSPRLTFGGQAYLYKLYVVRETADHDASDNVTPEFLRHLMPVLNAMLFSTRTNTP
jgi:hypothetical protein